MTASIPALLQPLKDRLEGADEPWQSMPALTDDQVIMHRVYDDDGRCIAECSSPQISEFIAAAPTDQAKLIAAVEAVEALHETEWVSGPDGNGSLKWCPACHEYAPCRTVAALTQALGGDTA